MHLKLYLCISQLEISEVIIDNKEFTPYIDKKAVAEAVQKLSDKINKEYHGKSIFFLGVLNGAFMFCADLMKEIKVECEISFIKVASYKGTSTTGSVHELIGLVSDLKNKHVIILEDIVDTGLTLDKVYSMIDHDHPASLEVAALLYKPSKFEGNHPPKYVGIEIPDEFVIGYGLDYDGKGRNIPEIYKLK